MILAEYKQEYKLIEHDHKFYIYRPIYKTIQFIFEDRTEAIKKYNSMIQFEQLTENI